MRARNLLVGLVAIAVLLTVGIYFGTRSIGNRLVPALRPHNCTAQAGDGLVTLGVDQMANAATIVAVGIRKSVPQRAVQIALATALQESKLENLSGGDRDSIGLFQQRPSQGWGTAKQIASASYASSRFYGALLKVKGWQKMSLTQAAQKVQRSATPDAYAQWTTEADTLSRALLGNTSHAIDCYVDSTPQARGALALGGLTTNLRSDWGTLLDLSRATVPNTLALSVRDDQAGWQYAHWLVAHAQDQGIMRVRFGTQQWTAKAGAWSAAGDPESAAPGETVVAEVYGQ